MNQIQQSTIQEIVTLHQEIAGHLKISLEKAIKIGELLTEQKESLKHGQFTPWIKDNLPFTDRTARNYMRLYHARDKLKTERVSDLNEAYRLLEAPIIHLKKEKIRRKIENQKAELEYCKTHKEEIQRERPIGTIKKGTLPCGWASETVITGYMNGLPFSSTRCIDPEYFKLEPGEAPKELQSLMSFEIANQLDCAKYNLMRSTTACKKLTENYGQDDIVGAYKLNWNEGIKYLYPEIQKSYSELKKHIKKFEKLMDRIESNQTNKGDNHERKTASSNL